MEAMNGVAVWTVGYVNELCAKYNHVDHTAIRQNECFERGNIMSLFFYFIFSLCLAWWMEIGVSFSNSAFGISPSPSTSLPNHCTASFSCDWSRISPSFSSLHQSNHFSHSQAKAFFIWCAFLFYFSLSLLENSQFCSRTTTSKHGNALYFQWNVWLHQQLDVCFHEVCFSCVCVLVVQRMRSNACTWINNNNHRKWIDCLCFHAIPIF